MIEKKMKNIHLLRIIYLNYMIVKLVKIITPSIIQKTKSLKTGIKFYKNTRFWGIV